MLTMALKLSTKRLFGPLTIALLSIVVTQFAVGCRTSHTTKSRSRDDIQICRQFLAEAGNTMEARHTDTFQADQLTLRQLRELTPRDPDFSETEFFVLRRRWKFENNGKVIVIWCAKAKAGDHGQLKYFAAFNDGTYSWVPESDVLEGKWCDYWPLRKLR